jgi:hypothetical protein
MEAREAKRSAQAEFAFGEANEARRLAAFPSWTGFAAASPQSHVAVGPKWPIAIGYGEELTQ